MIFVLIFLILSLSSNLIHCLQAVDGFVIVVNSDQKIMYVSQSCEKYLGHQNVRTIFLN